MNRITWIDKEDTSINGTFFPEFMYSRICALQTTIPQYPERIELIHLLQYRPWTPDEIRAHFYNIEYISNIQLCIDKDGQLSTKYNNDDSYFYIHYLHHIAQHSSHKKVYTQIKGEEYGIFSLPEPSNQTTNGSTGNTSTVLRNNYSTENRPTIEGPIIRRMYQGADYKAAGRALSVGLIEAKNGKKVIWLSENERQQVLTYIYNRRQYARVSPNHY
jgi:hypothetical protein